jgi:hypothetical protein
LERNGTERWSFLSFPFLSSEATGQSTDKSGFSSGYACYAAAASDGDFFYFFCREDLFIYFLDACF